MTNKNQLTADTIAHLNEYARLTAADMGEDFAAAVRAMRDEPQEVAADVGCSVTEVVEWCDAKYSDPEPKVYNEQTDADHLDWSLRQPRKPAYTCGAPDADDLCTITAVRRAP